jgi:adenosylcobinamide kinase/adenosylcobinamide-phosphate guanylyltransferase
MLGAFVEAMRNCIVVSNETGLGNIPFDEPTRRYNTLLARANRAIAGAADTVEFMISGIPFKVK